MLPGESTEKISLQLISLKATELPQEFVEDPKDKKKLLKEERAYKVPLKMLADQLVKYIYYDLQMQKYFSEES